MCLSKNAKQKLLLGQLQPLLRELYCLSCSTGFALSVFAFFYLTFCRSYFLGVLHLVAFFLEISKFVFYSTILEFSVLYFHVWTFQQIVEILCSFMETSFCFCFVFYFVSFYIFNFLFCCISFFKFFFT